MSNTDIPAGALCLFDPPASGAWNMALDEALLLGGGNNGSAVLRFYLWSEPTLSLGYFQKCEDRECHLPSVGCKAVRRATGGGAILHDRELTYTLTLPVGHPLGRRPECLYLAIHQTLIDVLARHGIEAWLCPAGQANRPAPEPFLCFQRRAVSDVLLGEHKIAGSAQRRHRGAVLQHGSILLAGSDFAPELPGLLELTGRLIEPGPLAEALCEALSVRLGLAFRFESLPAETWDRAAESLSTKFGSERWLHLR